MSSSTECPTCGSIHSQTKDSRNTKLGDFGVRRRRRRCSKCLTQFTTFELTQDVVREIEEKLEAYGQLLRALERVGLTKIRATAPTQDGRK